jgi:hypothetical protein
MPGRQRGAPVEVMTVQPAQGTALHSGSALGAISGVASRAASSPRKNAVSPPPGWAGPSMITRPMSMPSRGSRGLLSELMLAA